MNILEAINNSPDSWMVDIRSRDNSAVNSFPVGELKELIKSDGGSVWTQAISEGFTEAAKIVKENSISPFCTSYGGTD